jgi:hypothetical protein
MDGLRHSRKPQLPVLDGIRIASPCRANWEAMPGDDRSRFCSECSRTVFNLSGMTRAEAEALLRERGGDLCGRFYRRRDGTVLTADCPVGRWAFRRALAGHLAAVVLLFGAIPAVSAAFRALRCEEWPLWDREPYHSLALRLGIRRPTVVMGAIAAPPPRP